MKFKKPKNPFSELDQDYKTAIENMKDDEIKARVSQVAIAEHENREAKKRDADLTEKKAAVKLAGQQYADASKMNRLRIAYAHFILESRGKV